MKDLVNTLEEPPKQGKVSNAALDELRSLLLEQQFYVFYFPCREVIEDNDMIPSPCQLFSEVGTSKAGSTSDYHFFHLPHFSTVGSLTSQVSNPTTYMYNYTSSNL